MGRWVGEVHLHWLPSLLQGEINEQIWPWNDYETVQREVEKVNDLDLKSREIFYGKEVIIDKNGNLAVNVYHGKLGDSNTPIVAMFIGKALKPKYYYSFKDELAAFRFIKNIFNH